LLRTAVDCVFVAVRKTKITGITMSENRLKNYKNMGKDVAVSSIFMVHLIVI